MNVGVLIAAVTALLGGVCISYVNYTVTDKIMKSNPDKISFSAVYRQIMNIIYLVAVYFISTVFVSSVVYPLVGAVIGLTIPMFYFTYRLVKKNDDKNKR